MSKQRTIALKITGMTCGRCADRVRLALDKETGVIATEVSWEKGTAVVRFDSSQTTIEAILDNGVFNKDFKVSSSGHTHRYRAEEQPSQALGTRRGQA